MKHGGWHRLFVAVGILWGLVLGAIVEFSFPQNRVDFIKQALPVRLNGGQAPWWSYADIEVLPPLPDGFVLVKNSDFVKSVIRGEQPGRLHSQCRLVTAQKVVSKK